MFKFAVITVGLLALPAPAVAQIVFADPPPQFTPTKADKLKSDWDTVECRSEDVLGSRLERHQVCLTKWQWYSNEQQAKQRVYDWQRIGLTAH